MDDAGAGDDALRVLFLHSATAPPLGADVWVHAQIAANLDRRRLEVHAACAPGHPAFNAFGAIDGVHLYPVTLGIERSTRSAIDKARNVVAAAPAALNLLAVARYIRKHRIDIIHTSDRPRDAAACVLLGRLTGATSIVQAHVCVGDWMSRLLRWSLRYADARIAISSFVAGTLMATGHDADRTYVVLNGIEPTRWAAGGDRSGTRAALRIPDDAPVVMTACRLFPSKGAADLIRAFAALHPSLSDARLVVVGREMVPGYAAELTDLAATLGLADRVQLLGHRTDMVDLMAAADVFAMPSVGEPFGLVYLEAMAMERPVVALASGGVPEVVEPGATGLLSAPADVEALADNLGVLLAHPRRRARMGHAGRQRVESSFTSKRMADDVAAVYRQVLGRADELRVERGRDEVTVGL
jgi:glycosyltransferase involved in cell wall biosynthesis